MIDLYSFGERMFAPSAVAYSAQGSCMCQPMVEAAHACPVPRPSVRDALRECLQRVPLRPVAL